MCPVAMGQVIGCLFVEAMGEVIGYLFVEVIKSIAHPTEFLLHTGNLMYTHDKQRTTQS